MDDPDWDCLDCQCDTHLEYYMVKDKLWKKYGAGEAMLCIGCLEVRMSRQLEPNDFTNYPINNPSFWKKSNRLISRLTGVFDD